jgi:hypothetical protein
MLLTWLRIVLGLRARWGAGEVGEHAVGDGGAEDRLTPGHGLDGLHNLDLAGALASGPPRRLESSGGGRRATPQRALQRPEGCANPCSASRPKHWSVACGHGARALTSPTAATKTTLRTLAVPAGLGKARRAPVRACWRRASSLSVSRSQSMWRAWAPPGPWAGTTTATDPVWRSIQRTVASVADESSNWLRDDRPSSGLTRSFHRAGACGAEQMQERVRR